MSDDEMSPVYIHVKVPKGKATAERTHAVLVKLNGGNAVLYSER